MCYVACLNSIMLSTVALSSCFSSCYCVLNSELLNFQVSVYVQAMHHLVGASRSEPHISEVYIEIFSIYLLGEPERAPHKRERHARTVYYGTIVTRGAAHIQYIVCTPKYQTAWHNVCVHAQQCKRACGIGHVFKQYALIFLRVSL